MWIRNTDSNCTYHKLRELYDTAEAGATKVINDVHDLSLFIALEVLQRIRSNGIGVDGN